MNHTHKEVFSLCFIVLFIRKLNESMTNKFFYAFTRCDIDANNAPQVMVNLRKVIHRNYLAAVIVIQWDSYEQLHSIHISYLPSYNLAIILSMFYPFSRI